MTSRFLVAALLPALAVNACPTDPPEPETCVRPLAAATRVRYGAVSFPYNAAGAASDAWGVVKMETTGEISLTGQRFTMGRATYGEVAFTPDGEIGIATQDDGTLGVFKVAADGSVTVLTRRLAGSFYAQQVVMAPEGDRAFVADVNWQNNGGGIYEVGIACDGTVFDRGMLTDSKLAYAMALLPRGDQAVVAARELSDSAAGDDLHLIATDDPSQPLDGVDAFGHDEAIVSSLEVSPDGALAFVGDNSLFSGFDNGVAVVDLSDFSRAQFFAVEDPVDIEVSPFGGRGIVVSGFGDAIFTFSVDPSRATPVTFEGPLTYAGPRPQLPANAVVVERGSAKGVTLVAENTAIRRLRFTAGGGVEDLGPVDTGEGYEDITGAIGIQP